MSEWLCSVRAEEYTELGQAVGVHCGYNGAAEGMEGLGGQKVPTLALWQGDGAPGQTRRSFLISISFTLAQWRWPGVFKWSQGPGCGAGRAPGSCPTLIYKDSQMEAQRKKRNFPLNPSQAILLSTAARLGSLPPPLGRGSDFSKIV